MHIKACYGNEGLPHVSMDKLFFNSESIQLNHLVDAKQVSNLLLRTTQHD